jgi:GNAT superfamily N-acetyltransferase
VPLDDLLDSPALGFDLDSALLEFAAHPHLDAFGGVHAPGSDYADVEVATMNCVVATQDFHDFLLRHEVVSSYVSSASPEHVANLLGDTVIDWTLRQFDTHASVPTVEPLEVYRLRFPSLSLLNESSVNVYSKDEPWPYWWTPERRAAFMQENPSLIAAPHWESQTVAPADIAALEQEWLNAHPGYNITRGGAESAMGQALALASSTGHLLAVRTPDGALAGLLAYLEPNQYPNRHDSLHLAWMGVESGYQHQGMGSALLSALAEAAFRASKPITTSPATSESKGFFTSHGFRYLGWGTTWGGASERHYILPIHEVRALVERTRQIKPHDPIAHPAR